MLLRCLFLLANFSDFHFLFQENTQRKPLYMRNSGKGKSQGIFISFVFEEFFLHFSLSLLFGGFSPQMA
jgi:hypothetical protein